MMKHITHLRVIEDCGSRAAAHSGARTYLVRWQDEERGWRNASVIAVSTAHAIDLVADLNPEMSVFNARAYPV